MKFSYDGSTVACLRAGRPGPVDATVAPLLPEQPPDAEGGEDLGGEGPADEGLGQ